MVKQEKFTQLSVEQTSDYETVKELLLKGYELVPEAYRQKFRDCRKRKRSDPCRIFKNERTVV